MTQPQALQISALFNKVSAALVTASTHVPPADADEIDRLTDCAEQVADAAANVATNAAQTQFADAGKAFQEISTAAGNASDTADSICADVAKVGKILDIGAKIVSFGTAVVSGNYAAALTDLVNATNAA